jgi:hypothetical protein
MRKVYLAAILCSLVLGSGLAGAQSAPPSQATSNSDANSVLQSGATVPSGASSSASTAIENAKTKVANVPAKN